MDKLIEELLDALCNALPFVEDALTDPAFKKGTVQKVANQIRKTIAKAEKETHAKDS